MTSLIPEDISFNKNDVLYNNDNKDLFYKKLAAHRHIFEKTPYIFQLRMMDKKKNM
jgi:hypothetical protein